MIEKNRKYLKGFFEEFGFPDEARADLLGAYDRICENKAVAEMLCDAVCQYADTSYDFDSELERLHQAFIDADISYYQGEMIYVILLSRRLRELYAEAGIADGVFVNTMLDIKYKLFECKDVQGIWGTFVASWNKGFFKMHRFGLGRLQFDFVPFNKKYQGQGATLSEDSPRLAVHIPRTGTRLDYELVEDSYRQAVEFFAPRFEGAPIVFTCSSWLLYPRNKEILAPSSNLYKFISDYDIFNTKDFSSYREMWRLFDIKITEDIDSLPQNTSLRRAYADIMRKGEPLGEGYGVYVPKSLK